MSDDTLRGVQVLDQTYDRLSGCGPEFDGFLTNHGPMAADALIRLGHADAVEAWVSRYRGALEDSPGQRFAIEEAEWREPLGDPSRLGDWCALFARLVQEKAWQELLVEWWPRLMPGSLASATHCLIRTGHVVRALREQETPARVSELGRALGYWAARWQPFPTPAPQGHRGPLSALERVPGVASHGGSRTRLAELAQSSGWKASLDQLRSVPTVEAVPEAVDALVDAAVTGYGRWGQHNPVMLVHAATGPRAIGLILPSLPQQHWRPAYDTAWLTSAAISGAYRGDEPQERPPAADRAVDSAEEVSAAALGSQDEHAIKFTEVAVESHGRGNSDALSAAALSSSLLAD